MNWRRQLGLWTLLLLTLGHARADEAPLEIILPPLKIVPPLQLAQTQPKDTKPPKQATPPKVEAPPTEPQLGDLFAQTDPQGPSDASGSGASHPYMVGDLNGGAFVVRTITLPTTVTLNVTDGEVSKQITVNGTTTRQYTIPLAALGSFKIGENESPVPRNRVFATYNYFSNVAAFPTSGDSAPTFDTSFLQDNQEATVLGFTPSAPLSSLNVHRQTFGIEKLFFGNDFSLSFRLPYIQQTGVPQIASSQIGNVSILAKYAFINNPETGNVVSTGLMLTLPTGQDVLALDGIVNTPLIQPWVGYFVNMGNFFVQGFSSIIVPTDLDNVTLLANDLAVGYRFYRNEDPSALVRFVFPAVEAHLTNPLNHRGVDSVPVGFPDIFVTTAALYIGLGNRSILTLATATPLTGPQPFDVEGIVQFNFYY